MNIDFVPIFVMLFLMGAPALYLHIIRSSRVKLRQLELEHDTKIADLTRERDMLDAKLQVIEPQLDFFRQLAAGAGAQRLRIDQLPTQAPPPARVSRPTTPIDVELDTDLDAEQATLDDAAVKPSAKRA